MLRHTGPGKYFIKVDGLPEVVRLWLYNFDIEGSALKPEHKDVLDRVGPLIRDGGAIKLLGLASTTGTAAYDRALSERRMHEVVNFLRLKFGSTFAVTKEIAFGKDMALAFGARHLPGGTADQQESDVWRGAVLNAWNRPLPPPPPPGLDVPFNDSTWANDASKAIDTATIALGLLDLLADLGELSALAEVTGPAGLILGVLTEPLQMPLMWASADALANTNGQIQGAADAMQDMADQFSSPSLDMTPISRWPAVSIPDLHIPENPQPNASQEAWRAGQIVGRQNAVKAILDLEQNPRPVTLPDQKHVRISGRLWLRIASKVFKDNVGVEKVIKPANEELRKRGKPPFPTH